MENLVRRAGMAVGADSDSAEPGKRNGAESPVIGGIRTAGNGTATIPGNRPPNHRLPGRRHLRPRGGRAGNPADPGASDHSLCPVSYEWPTKNGTGAAHYLRYLVLFGPYGTMPRKKEKPIQAALLGGDFGTCKFNVEQVEKQGENYRVLLSCNQRVEAVAMVRRLTVKILSD